MTEVDCIVTEAVGWLGAGLGMRKRWAAQARVLGHVGRQADSGRRRALGGLLSRRWTARAQARGALERAGARQQAKRADARACRGAGCAVKR